MTLLVALLSVWTLLSVVVAGLCCLLFRGSQLLELQVGPAAVAAAAPAAAEERATA
jgi:hypothetical protein